MEITLEMVERLRERAPVSYALAKRALEYSGGNLLDALIYLEEQRAIPREEGTYYTTRSEAPPPPAPSPEAEGEKKGSRVRPRLSVKGLLTTLRRWLVDNELEVWRKGQPITALPVLILALLLCCALWVTLHVTGVQTCALPILFAGFRYRFSGPDLEREELNSVMGSVADTAAGLGRQVMEELKHDWHSDEK